MLMIKFLYDRNVHISTVDQSALVGHTSNVLLAM